MRSYAVERIALTSDLVDPLLDKLVGTSWKKLVFLLNGIYSSFFFGGVVYVSSLIRWFGLVLVLSVNKDYGFISVSDFLPMKEALASIFFTFISWADSIVTSSDSAVSSKLLNSNPSKTSLWR